MNCPSHYLLYGSAKHSYKELPIRYSTYDVLHRNEVSGALSGLTRVRQFQQDDCHIFLMERQIAEEVRGLTRFILDYYKTFGLTASLKFATRPEQRIGDDADVGPGRGRHCVPRWRRRDSRTNSRKAMAPSMVRRSTSTSPIPSAGPGSSARSSSTTRPRSVST